MRRYTQRDEHSGRCHRARRFLAALCLSVSVVLNGILSWASTESFLRDCETLTRSPHRLAGTEECHRAIDAIIQRLEQINPDKLIVQEFPVAQTRVKRCEVEIQFASETSVTLPLQPIRPNGIIAPVSPREGITGPIVNINVHSPDPFGGKSVEGAIVVLDYNCWDAWLRAFRLGAKAVIFAPSGHTYAWHSHFSYANTNLPRFYYEGSAADFQQGAIATIHSEVVWDDKVGKNVLAFFEGTDPVFHQDKEELIILATAVDSYGEVPTLSPGARGAANCASLLRLTEHLARNRPRRHVLVAFFDGQARGHLGVSAFYKALEKDQKDVAVDKRKEYLENEWNFLSALEKALDSNNPLQPGTTVRREMVRRLKEAAKAHSFRISGDLYDLRKQLMEQSEGSSGYEAIVSNIELRQAESDLWNDLRRALARDNITPSVSNELGIVLADVRRDMETRQAELEFERRALSQDEQVRDLISEMWIALHLSFLFGDTTTRYGVIIGGDSSLCSGDDLPGLYTRIQSTFLSAYNAVQEQDASVHLFEVSSADGTLDPPRLLWGAPFLIHSGEVAGKAGIYNLCVGTVQEYLPREGTPQDTLDRLDLKRMEDQINDFSPLFLQLASEDGLSLRRSIKTQIYFSVSKFESDNRPTGPTVMARAHGNAMPNMPMPRTTIQVIQKFHTDVQPGFMPRKPYAFDNYPIVRSNQNGVYSYGPTHPVTWLHFGFGATFDERGQLTSVADRWSWRFLSTRLNLLNCLSGYVILPAQINPTEAAAYKAKGNSVLEVAKSYTETVDGVFFWHCEDKIDAVKYFGLQSVIGLNNGPEILQERSADQEEPITPDGIGFSTHQDWTPPPSARRSASDLWRLNESRLELLRSKDIINNSVEELHGHAEDLMLQANELQSLSAREALANSALLIERPVYQDTKTTLDDLIRAVLILLALCVPFAFAVERLLIGATTIYRQIGGFTGFFIFTFMILFYTHPAFAISATPIVIFLGFAVVVLSALVIFIIMRKFEVELKVLQGLTSTVHAADVSRFSTVMAAMSMGISTMRRRPLRTLLTATTIILLTFTILCFASFGTQTGIVRLFLDAAPEYSGVFVHDVNWSQFNLEVLDVLRGRWSQKTTICPRLWISPRTEQNQGPLLTHEDGSSPLALKGVLGLASEEISLRPDLQSLMGTDLDNWDSKVFITQAVSEHTGLREGDRSVVGGMRLTVGKILEGSQLAMITDMDRNSILPVDFVTMQSVIDTARQQQQQQRRADTLAREVQQNWAHLPTDSIVIVSPANARVMGANLHAVTLYTETNWEAAELATDLAKVFDLSISATRPEGVFRHTLGLIVQASGAKDLFFPIVLGGLVIFGTMLGSVADREREIYTFSSLGLAPPHVASLFFAEAMVYSVLGGMGGYLIAQGMMKILSLLAGLGLARVPEMNYSSMNAIVTILIVMATVLISAIYPAMKASRSANPGILRTWRLPAPTGDSFDIAFPFTVSNYDITGVVSFLKEHFENFGDTGLGVFMAQEPRLVKDENDMLGLDARIALAPFDLGVTQTFQMRSTPSEIEGIDEVRIRLHRLSGQPKDWRRLNKVLLDDLRRQFLIWRALPEETMEIYRHKTWEAMGESPESQIPNASVPEPSDSETREDYGA